VTQGTHRRAMPGLALVLLLALMAVGLAEVETRVLGQPLIEALVLALLLGVLARNVLSVPRALPFHAGATFASKQILEVGVALLGASVFFPAIVRAGPSLLGLVVGGVALGILVSYGAGRALGLHSTLAILVAVGNSICGNSAIAAVAPVIRAEKKDVAAAISLTAVLGVALVLLLPLSIAAFGLSHYQYGVLAGMSVYAVPQVVAAAFPVSELSGEVATLVKLTRVLLLGPVVLIFGMLFRGGGARRSLATYVPWFVAGFLVLATVRSLGFLPDPVANGAREVSRWLTILAMAGLGFGVELASVRHVGPRVAVAVLVSLAFLATLTLVALHTSGLGAP
jgi:uncharacterized integral membrane protein (TIGR00698 family)